MRYAGVVLAALLWAGVACAAAPTPGLDGKQLKDASLPASKHTPALNGASGLVQLDGTAKLPAVDGSLLTGVVAASCTTAPTTALLATGSVIGATDQSQIFTNGITRSNLTTGWIPRVTTSGQITGEDTL